MDFLCVIEDVFEISDRGCVIVPGLPNGFSPPVGIGAQLLLQKPDGSTYETTVAGVEMINRGKPMDHIPISLPKPISKTDVPIGSILFYLRPPSV